MNLTLIRNSMPINWQVGDSKNPRSNKCSILNNAHILYVYEFRFFKYLKSLIIVQVGLKPLLCGSGHKGPSCPDFT